MEGCKLYWGDSHTNLHSRHMDQLDASLAHARQVIDFWPIAYYPYHMYPMNGFTVEHLRPAQQLDSDWKAICDLAAEHNRDGRFVIFPGYEWQGDGSWGDHNVFFLEDYPPLILCAKLAELYAELRARGLEAYAIPHHLAYQPGIRSKDWSVHDEAISPFAEVYSVHGCSESDEEWIGLRSNRNMGPSVSGNTMEDGLRRGWKVGIICSNDSHQGAAAVHGLGVMAAWSKALTRRDLWEAFASRRVYGTTGDRIELEFTVESAPMGAVLRKSGAVRALARVRGCDALDRIELIRNNRVIATHCHNGTWEPPAGEGAKVRCKLRIEAGWNTSPKTLPDQPPRKWEGSLEVADGSIVGVERCWRTLGQRVGSVGGNRCDFGFTTCQEDPSSQRVHTEALVFEIEARPCDTVRIAIDGKRAEMTLAEAMSASRILDFIDENAAFVERAYGLKRQDLPRLDRLYFLGPKVKVHRAIPQSGLAGELDFTDRTPPAGVNHYRVRVEQRNGHAAWSSPVWVEN